MRAAHLARVDDPDAEPTGALSLERAPLSAADKAQLIQDVSDDILGYGPIDRLLKDDSQPC